MDRKSRKVGGIIPSIRAWADAHRSLGGGCLAPAGIAVFYLTAFFFLLRSLGAL